MNPSRVHPPNSTLHGPMTIRTVALAAGFSVVLTACGPAPPAATRAVAPLYYNVDVIAHLDSLRGVTVTAYSMVGHTIEDWELN